MSSGTDDVRYHRYLRRVLWFVLAAGAATLGLIGATMLTAGQASAQTLNVPGIGAIDVPDQVEIPAGIAEALHLVPGSPRPHASPVPRVVTDEALLSGIVRSAVAPAPVPVSAPAPAPAPQSGAAQFDTSALPPILDIPPVRQFLSMPQFRGLTLPAPPAQAAPPAQVAPHQTTGERAVEAARSKLGAAYRYGSAGPDAFDCSGLVQWSYRQAGVTLPRTSYSQLDFGTPVPLSQLQPGDLVSFYGGEHSAIYEGNGRVIHAATERTGVTESSISQMPVAGARRF